MILALLLLSWTNPPQNVHAAAYEVWKHVQSPTWVLHAAAINAGCMVGSADTMACYIPEIRAEAEWFKVAEFVASGADAGKRCSVQVADGAGDYAVVVRDSSGLRSAYSNEVGR